MADPTGWQKEQLSRAYLHAVATRGGFTIASWNVDKDGVDTTLRRGGLMVDLQLKCISSPATTATGYSYQLDAATYDKLRDRDRSAPGYIALMIARADLDDWITHADAQLVVGCHAYWAQLQDRTDAATGDTKAVAFPRSQVLSAAAIEKMFAYSLHMVRRGR